MLHLLKEIGGLNFGQTRKIGPKIKFLPFSEI